MSETTEWFDADDAFRDPTRSPGLFITEQARKSAARAHQALFSSGVMIKLPLSEHKKLRKSLEKIANQYWADKKYDDRKSLAKIKDELRNLQVCSLSTINALNELSSDAQQAINEKRTWDTHSRVLTNLVAQSIQSISALKITVDSLVVISNTKQASLAVRSCSSSLWDLRENITGKPFKRVYKLERGRKGSATEGFAADDARFVSVIMTAIDKKVSHQTIRTKLMEVAPKKPKRYAPQLRVDKK